MSVIFKLDKQFVVSEFGRGNSDLQLDLLHEMKVWICKKSHIPTTIVVPTLGVKVRNMKMDFNTNDDLWFFFIRLSCLVALYNKYVKNLPSSRWFFYIINFPTRRQVSLVLKFIFVFKTVTPIVHTSTYTNDSKDAFSTSPGPLKSNKGNLSFQSEKWQKQ